MSTLSSAVGEAIVSKPGATPTAAFWIGKYQKRQRKIKRWDKRLLFLGKESWLVSQTKSDNKWFDNFIKDEELTYETVSLFLNQMQ